MKIHRVHPSESTTVNKLTVNYSTTDVVHGGDPRCTTFPLVVVLSQTRPTCLRVHHAPRVVSCTAPTLVLFKDTRKSVPKTWQGGDTSHESRISSCSYTTLSILYSQKEQKYGKMYKMTWTCMVYTYISMEKEFSNFPCYKILNLCLPWNVHHGTYECTWQYVIVGIKGWLFCYVLLGILKPYLEFFWQCRKVSTWKQIIKKVCLC